MDKEKYTRHELPDDWEQWPKEWIGYAEAQTNAFEWETPEELDVAATWGLTIARAQYAISYRKAERDAALKLAAELRMETFNVLRAITDDDREMAAISLVETIVRCDKILDVIQPKTGEKLGKQ